MKIGIRADGGQNIGMGHIMRSLVLAKELAKTNEVFYVCRVSEYSLNKYKAGIDMVKSKGFKVETLNENSFIEELCKVNADCLITDSYDVNEDYFNITKNFFKVTGCIDDMNLYYFNVDFIINQNIGAERYIYNVNKDTKLLLGTNYTMMREEFRNIPEKVITQECSDIMITVGGSDDKGITNIICDYVKDLKLKFHIIIGPGFKEENINKLIEIENLKSNIKLYLNANMIEIMKKCDMAISSCGSTLYELAACGVPTLGIVIADNQKQIADELQSIGFIKKLGIYNEIHKEDLVKKIYELSENTKKRSEMSKKGLFIVDGKGVERIVGILSHYNN
jgi:pseudaminic acid biosynthesis-associated protein PseG